MYFLTLFKGMKGTLPPLIENPLHLTWSNDQTKNLHVFADLLLAKGVYSPDTETTLNSVYTRPSPADTGYSNDALPSQLKNVHAH